MRVVGGRGGARRGRRRGRRTAACHHPPHRTPAGLMPLSCQPPTPSATPSAPPPALVMKKASSPPYDACGAKGQGAGNTASSVAPRPKAHTPPPPRRPRAASRARLVGVWDHLGAHAQPQLLGAHRGLQGLGCGQRVRRAGGWVGRVGGRSVAAVATLGRPRSHCQRPGPPRARDPAPCQQLTARRQRPPPAGAAPWRPGAPAAQRRGHEGLQGAHGAWGWDKKAAGARRRPGKGAVHAPRAPPRRCGLQHKRAGRGDRGGGSAGAYKHGGEAVGSWQEVGSAYRQGGGTGSREEKGRYTGWRATASQPRAAAAAGCCLQRRLVLLLLLLQVAGLACDQLSPRPAGRGAIRLCL